MRLSDKIYNCRRQKGYSQEQLAELLGVSRQSVSKWEIGEAMPDINKLIGIANIFGVTTDWLLSNDEVSVEPKIEAPIKNYPSWLDKLPSSMLRMIKKFGWIFGVYVMCVGGGVIGMGFLSRFMFKKMIFNTISDSMIQGPGGIFDLMNPSFNIGNVVGSFESSIWSIASAFTWGMIGIGVVIVIVGLILTIALRKFRKKEVNL